MASWNIASRLSSRSQPIAVKLSKTSVSLLSSASQSPARRISRIPRLPMALSSIGSMMPLHSATASARLLSSLSIDGCGWGLVPQGISMPL
ncbi:hypothetical protein SLA2020_221860 [Shorea laevis]